MKRLHAEIKLADILKMAMEMTYSCAHGDPCENRSRPYDLLLGPEAEVHHT
jgi:hypothetical protein